MTTFAGETLGQEVCRLYNEMQADRGVFESYWEDIAQVMWPNMRNQFRAGSFNTPGMRNHELQMDSRPQLALHRFAAILTSLLTPATQKWHYLRSNNPELNKVRRVQEWFEQTNDVLWRLRGAQESQFGAQNRLAYIGLGALGTTALFIDPLRGSGVRGTRYKNVHVGELYLKENHQGEVDTVIRRFELTARQIMQKEGWRDAAPKQVREAAASRPDEKFCIYHLVRPRSPDVFDPEALDQRSLPFESVYVAEADKTVLEEGGFRSLPYAVSRYEMAPGEVYGRSPAMMAFAAIKTRMAQKRDLLIQGQRAVHPVLLTADDGVLDISLRPGALVPSAVSQDGRPLVQPLPAGDIPLGMEMMAEEQSIIDDTFLVSLYQILVETPDRMTATQVLERAQEKGQLLAPTVGQQQDYLGRIINREIDVAMAEGLLPPMPGELIEAGGEYSIQYDNPLTRASRSGEVAGLFRFLESVLPIIQTTGDPSPLDHIDWNAAAPEIAEISAVPVRWRRTLEQVQAVQEGRRRAQEAAQAANQAPAQAQLLQAAATAKEKGLRAEDLQ